MPLTSSPEAHSDADEADDATAGRSNEGGPPHSHVLPHHSMKARFQRSRERLRRHHHHHHHQQQQQQQQGSFLDDGGGGTDLDYAADNSSEQEPSSSLSGTPAASPPRGRLPT